MPESKRTVSELCLSAINAAQRATVDLVQSETIWSLDRNRGERNGYIHSAVRELERALKEAQRAAQKWDEAVKRWEREKRTDA